MRDSCSPGFAGIDRVRAAFAGVPAEEIEAETDRILARNRAGMQPDESTSRVEQDFPQSSPAQRVGDPDS
jgi:hypothetical protein